jgi:hypothetical protein
MRHVAVVNAVYRKGKLACVFTERHTCVQRVTMAKSMFVYADDAGTVTTSTLVRSAVVRSAVAPAHRLAGRAVLAGTGALLLGAWPSSLVPDGSCALLYRRP